MRRRGSFGATRALSSLIRSCSGGLVSSFEVFSAELVPPLGPDGERMGAGEGDREYWVELTFSTASSSLYRVLEVDLGQLFLYESLSSRDGELGEWDLSCKDRFRTGDLENLR